MKNFTLPNVLSGTTLLLAITAITSLPGIAFAENYFYINTSGSVQAVTAASPEAALALATNKAPRSGVAVDMGVLDVGDSVSGGQTMSDGHQYHYIDQSGTVRTITAMSPAHAFSLAVGIASHSGVALDAGVLHAGDSVSGE